MRFYDSLWKLAKFLEISHYVMAYFLAFIQLQYSSWTFSFAFGPLKSLPQNFGLFQNGSKFWNFVFGNGESGKSQYHRYLALGVGVLKPISFIIGELS